MGGAGTGNVDKKKLAKNPDRWGGMPEKDKVKALEAISRQMPSIYREAGEGYAKKLQNGPGGQ